MSRQSLFSMTKTVYWPSEYTDIVNMLKGRDEHDKLIHSPMYKYNTGAMVLAATLGLVHGREREVGSARQEISTDTFVSHGLEAYVMLIPVLGRQDIELLRLEREDELLRTFERYAAGGFEYLRGALSRSADTTGQTTLHQELQAALQNRPEGSDELVDLLFAD